MNENELREFLGKQFDAVYDRTKSIHVAIEETIVTAKKAGWLSERQYFNNTDCPCQKGWPHALKDGDPIMVNSMCPCDCHYTV